MRHPASMSESFNSFGPSNAIWRKRYESTLIQLIARCLMAPSHNLNQCWLESIGIHPLGNFSEIVQGMLAKTTIKNHFLKLYMQVRAVCPILRPGTGINHNYELYPSCATMTSMGIVTLYRQQCMDIVTLCSVLKWPLIYIIPDLCNNS